MAIMEVNVPLIENTIAQANVERQNMQAECARLAANINRLGESMKGDVYTSTQETTGDINACFNIIESTLADLQSKVRNYVSNVDALNAQHTLR